jgi:hypothetical protein
MSSNIRRRFTRPPRPNKPLPLVARQSQARRLLSCTVTAWLHTRKQSNIVPLHELVVPLKTWELYWATEDHELHYFLFFCTQFVTVHDTIMS